MSERTFKGQVGGYNVIIEIGGEGVKVHGRPAATAGEMDAYLSGFEKGVKKEAWRLKNEVKLKAFAAADRDNKGWPEEVLRVLQGVGLYDTDTPPRAPARA